MPKAKTRFVCQNCGYEAPRWMGRCPGCEQWNTLVEEVEPRPQGHSTSLSRPGATGNPVAIAAVEATAEPRLVAGLAEVDRVLGGGIVPGSLVLVGGDPGIGKSTLLLQISRHVAAASGPVLYVSGEESVRQVRLRADRLGALDERLFVMPETELEQVAAAVERLQPKLCVIDSIQTVYRSDVQSAPGSVGQVRECAAELMRLAKTLGVPIFIVGHVTKSGDLAGPRVLEHIVDTVLYLEGERHQSYRILRAAKNRFGSTNEIGVFLMEENGLAEVDNPSEVFLAERPAGAAGSVVVCSLEGTRPLLVEVQALVAATTFPAPRRTAAGVDYNRLVLLLAVLEKRAGLNLSAHDAYVKVSGGARVDEPAGDLAVITAVASSLRNSPVPERMVILGEVGLTGEVRAVSRLDERLGEAAKLGFTDFLVPAGNLRRSRTARERPPGLRIHPVSTVEQAVAIALSLDGRAAAAASWQPD
ncbi:MAG: DNA repair protein RadA [Bacillota bacterium]